MRNKTRAAQRRGGAKRQADARLREARAQTRAALAEQAATAEILGVIASSIADTAPVFDKILESCQRLFAGTIVGLNLVGEDGKLHIGAYHGAHRQEFERIFPIPLNTASGSGLCMLEHRMVHYPDTENGREVPERTRTGCKAIGIRSVIFAPVQWEGRGLGAIFVGRDRVSSFSEREIALLKTFADQAAIAIENVRLFNETKEALEQQTATAEILKVTSASPADAKPVFEAILAHASNLCGASVAAVFLYDGEVLTNVAARNASPEFARFMSGVRSLPSLDTTCRRCALERKTIHTSDLLSDPEFAPPEPHHRENIRTVLSVPMLREESLIGVITLWRREVRPFTAKQIALVETFARQAVLAIENVRLFNEIQQTSRQLEAASRHKSEFLANMSHELRTPLNAIIGFTRIVMRRSKEALEPLQYDNLEKILASGQNLLALINSILDLSKIEAGRIEVHATQVSLAPLLEQCMRTVEPLVRADAVALVKEFDGVPAALYTDEEKLRQIVLNLLGNAVKFTERGEIRLSARAENGSLDVAVSDTGIGIPADQLELIFEEFEQVDASSTRAHGGTGLGLAIARRLARLMGGDVRAESLQGRGSTFTLSLPVRQAA
jgi:signal transduction histidine kinase